MAVQLPDQLQERLRPHTGHGLPALHDPAALVLILNGILLVWVVRILGDPAWANLEGKAPVARAVLYPLWTLTLPVLWLATRRASTFPWLAELLVTLTCFSDVLGNRLDLYNSIAWFDDGMHVMNTALVSAAFLVVTLPRSAGLRQIVEAAVAVGMTASLGWELFEYGTFLTRSTEWTSAYSDTVGDLSLGWLGSVLAALVVATAWRHRSGHLPVRAG